MSLADSPGSLRRQFPVGMLVVIGLLGAVNFLLMPVISSGGPAGMGMGLLLTALFATVAAEAGILAVWLVWCEWPLSLRLALHWLAALFLFGCWALGVVVAWQADRYFPVRFWFQPKILLGTAAALPPISLAVQLPLWFCRLVFGWRLLRTPSGQPPTADRKLSVGDLLFGTTLVAISLGCLRLVAFDPQQIQSAYWAGWGLGMLALIAVSTTLVLPLLAIILRPAQNASAGALMVAFWAVVLGSVGTSLVLSLRAAGAPPPAYEILLVSTALLTSFCGTLAAPLWLARSLGYRLRFRRDQTRSLV
jgi:hypothetical protein